MTATSSSPRAAAKPAQRVLTIILARAGSKGVPGKNRAPIAGKPCILWTIEHAQQNKHAGVIVVSTDDPAIAAIARRARVLVVQRPAELAGDTATVDSAARHALLAVEAAHKTRFTNVVILYANVPLRPAGLVDRAIELLRTSRSHSVQSYAPVGKYHPWWTARVDPITGNVKPWEGNVLNHGVYRRQNLPPAFIPDGGIIALTRAALMLEVKGAAPGPHACFGARRRGIINPEGGVIDIDSPTDLVVASATLAALKPRGAPSRSPAKKLRP